jgi:glycosyltransferase involved in cell wall biosynthesis
VAVRVPVSAPRVSVVIPTHGRGSVLDGCLRSLVSVDFARDAYEVIVVDAASPDDTPVVIQRWAADSRVVRYLRVEGRDANAARNAGIGGARAELVALIDDDVVVPPGWLGALWDGAGRWPSVHCFGGPVRPMLEDRVPATCAVHELAGLAIDEGPLEHEVGEVWGCNMALRRSAFGLAGPFREGLARQQEWEWEMRLLAAGGRMVYLPEVWLWHRRTTAEMRLVAMLREFFVRGYIKGTLGPGVSPRAAASRGARWLRHGARTGCARGWTEAARSAGLVCGSATRWPRSDRAR